MRWTVTDDIYRETWRQIADFSNLDFVSERIKGRFSQADATNIKKQASNARVCVLQAKEYFDAARSSSLYTSPNHAYYGSISLASLIMLLRGDGTCSLDYLRKSSSNKHHGLEFTTGCTAATAKQRLNAIENSRVRILDQGHFKNWYRVLPNQGHIAGLVEAKVGKTRQQKRGWLGSFDVPSFDTIIGRQYSGLELLRFLPDMNRELTSAGLAAPSSRMTHKMVDNGEEITHEWLVHGCRTSADRDSLLDGFAVTPRFSDCFSLDLPDSFTAVIRLKYKRSEDLDFRWPASRESLNHDSYLFAHDHETHEIVDLYLLSYQLSMLSRYFPDIWIGCLESQCTAARLIDRAVQLIIRKLPILALAMLREEEVVISTHREPWLA